MPSDGTVDDDKLCCCEYINAKGDRSHLLACCCDCEAFDEAMENLITCRAVPVHLIDKILDTVVDRCRLPGPVGMGAQRARFDRIIPIISVPLLLYISTYGSIHTLISFLAMPVVMIVFQRLWRRTVKSRRTDFYFYWGCTSVLFSLVTFETAVISFREILLWENLSLVTMTVLAVYALNLCRIDPGYVRRGKERSDSSFIRRIRRRDASRGDDEELRVHLVEEKEVITDDGDGPPAYSVAWVDSRPFSEGRLVTWCTSCLVERAPRSGHCTVCNWCVEGRDHHCVWINSCIGARNHRSFIIAWTLIVIVGFYGCQLTLTSVCTPEMYMDWFLLPYDCRFVYSDIYNALGFVTALYGLIVSCLLAIGLVHQLLLIGQNITMQEFHRAGSRGMLRYGLIARNNFNNRGFWRNVRDFWTGRKLSYDSSLSI